MSTPIKILLTLVSLAIGPCMLCQTYFTSNYTSHDGLPSNQITCLAQNQQGYLWVGTNKGLVRWGQEFDVFNKEHGLPSDRISAILPLANETLWIGTADKGLCLLSQNKSVTFDNSNGLMNQNVRCLSYSQRHNLLFAGTANGIAVYNGKRFVPFFDKNNAWIVNCFMETDTAMLFATKGQGMFYYHFHKKNTFPVDRTSRLYEQTVHAWMTTLTGDTLVSCRERSIKILSKSHMSVIETDKTVMALSTDTKGQIFAIAKGLSTTDNAALYQWENNKLKLLSKQFIQPSQNISSFLIDTQEDVLVIGTAGKGLVLWPGPMFHRYSATGECGSLRDGTIDANGNVWFLANSPVVLDKSALPRNYSTSICGISNKIITDKTQFTGKICATNQSVLYAADNQLWETGLQAPFKCKKLNIKQDTISYFDFCSDLLLVKGQRALRFYSWNPLALLKQEKMESDITNTSRTNGYIWILDANKKLWCFDISNTTLKKASEFFPILPFNINKITTTKNGQLILVDDLNNIWMADFAINSKSPTLKKLEAPYLSGNSILWILSDSRNRLWIGTDLGLSLISLDGHTSAEVVKSSNWGKGEGYASTESFKAIEDNSGKIWVFSEDRAIVFDPALIAKIHRQPMLKVTSITATGGTRKQTITQMFAISNAPTFASRNNSLVFSFDITNLMNKDKVMYQYRLMPGNTEWSEPTKQPFVFLSTLQPGHYKLNVKAWFKHMPQNSTEMTLGFSIRQPWFQTVYAYVAYAIITILILLWVFEVRIRQLRKREAYKTATSEKIALLKMEALQAQMNPHFIFNALNTLQYNILENNTEYSIEFLGEFSKLIRSTLDNASQHFISLKDEIDYIESYMKVEQMRYSQKFYYSISLSNDIDTNHYFVPPMIIQPHIENAIKYAFDTSIGYIIISISKVHDKLICMVEDNGIGRKKSLMKKKNHKSKGQTITSQRFEMLNKFYSKKNEYRYEIEDLHDEDGKPSGTRVTLFFPLLTQDEAMAANTND